MDGNKTLSAPKHLIIPAAGLGTRMRTVNQDVPKEMLPLGNRKIIDYAIQEGISANIKNIVLIISRQKENIREHITRHYRGSSSITIEFVYQKKLLGECDAISCARDVVGNNPFAVIYPDNIYLPAPGALNEIIPVFERFGKDVIALSEVHEEIATSFSNAGRVDLRKLDKNIYKIERFIPKSSGYFIPRHKRELRACGIYLSGPYFFEYIEIERQKSRQAELTDDPVRATILVDRGFIGCKLNGMVFDVGNPRGYDLCVARIKNNSANQ